MKDYPKPLVTISLDEYNDLLAKSKTQPENKFKLAIEGMLTEIADKGNGGQYDFGKVFKKAGLSFHAYRDISGLNFDFRELPTS